MGRMDERSGRCGHSTWQRVVFGGGGNPDQRPAWWSLRRFQATRIGELLGADLRSLALFRIGLALIVLGDLISRLPGIRLLYTNEGMMPRDLVVEGAVPWRWSLNFINDMYGFQLALFIVAIAAAVGLLAGYRTRLMSVILWVLVCSIQARNPMVLSGADTLLRVVLFWAMFLPLGAVWSMDRQNGRWAGQLSLRTLSFATIGFYFQIAFMYWFTAILKNSPEWRSEGTALFYALNADHVTKPFSTYLLQFPELLRVLTHGTLALEFLAPVLMLVPFWNGPLRTLGCASIISLHIGIFLTLDVGAFPWISSICMLAFLPAWFWDTVVARAGAWFSKAGSRYAVTSQRVLQPVQQALGFVSQRLAGTPYPVSADGAGVMTHSRSNGFTSAFTRPSGGVTPRTGSDEAVQWVRAGRLTNFFLAFCLLFVFLWNLATVSSFAMPAETRPFAYASGLYQKWNMFAPRPSTGTTWIVIRGVLENGQAINLLTPIVRDDLSLVSDVSWAQPDDIPGEYYGNKHWRKYLTALGFEDNKDDRREFAVYSCRAWNNHYTGDERLRGLQIFRMTKPTQLDDEETPTHRRLLAEYQCA
jgi:hypothetical protein